MTDNYDPYWVAAYEGSTEALQVLLDHYTDEVESLDKRGYLLLNVVCQAAQLETTRFLLDHGQDWPHRGHVADLLARDCYGMTALLSAASSFTNMPFYEEYSEDQHMLDLPLQDYVARAENVINLLLDRGAHAGDTCPYTSSEAGDETQVRHSVIRLAIPRASAILVTRLLAAGAGKADAPKTTHLFNNCGHEELSRNVTPLHIGALYSNFEGIQVLLNHNSGMVKITDSYGRLPLHWAAAGPGRQDYMLIKDEIVPHVLQTTTLLLAHNPDAINIPDSQGKTALHHACAAAVFQDPQQVIRNTTLLLERGADCGYRDADVRTPMHFLLERPNAMSEAELLELMETMQTCGADVRAADAQKNTPLHLAARSLARIQIVKFLLEHGASASAINATGSTPLHEAARGYVVIPRSSPDSPHQEGQQQQQSVRLTAEIRIRKQDEMIAVLLDAAAADGDDPMDHPDEAVETPRMICDITRSKWRVADGANVARRGGLGP